MRRWIHLLLLTLLLLCTLAAEPVPLKADAPRLVIFEGFYSLA